MDKPRVYSSASHLIVNLVILKSILRSSAHSSCAVFHLTVETFHAVSPKFVHVSPSSCSPTSSSPIGRSALKKTGKRKTVQKNSSHHIPRNTLKSAPTLLTWPPIFQSEHGRFRNKIPPPPTIQHDRFHPYDPQMDYVAKRNWRSPDFDVKEGERYLADQKYLAKSSTLAVPLDRSGIRYCTFFFLFLFLSFSLKKANFIFSFLPNSPPIFTQISEKSLQFLLRLPGPNNTVRKTVIRISRKSLI